MFPSISQTHQFLSAKVLYLRIVYRSIQFACLVLLLAGLWISPLRGAQFGDYTYTVSGSSVTITDFPTTISGSIVIPEQIEGKNVTKIGTRAFQACSITSVTIPSGVTSIAEVGFSGNTNLQEVIILSPSVTLGMSAFSSCYALKKFTFSAISGLISSYAFGDCRSLEIVNIPPAVTVLGEGAFIGCWGLKKLGLGAVTNIGKSAFSECWQISEISLPVVLKIIDDRAFADCSNIRIVKIPASVTILSTHAFQFCTNLSEVIFEGNAPLIGANVFYGTKSNITLYYYKGSTGFSSPIWYDLPAVNLGDRKNSEWLASYGYSYNTSMLSDMNYDGVSLLMAYALNLDPNTNLSGSMPKAVYSNGILSMTFFAGTSGITYIVETSDDLKNWTTSGVTLSPIGGNKNRTASIPASVSRRFLRLVVGQ